MSADDRKEKISTDEIFAIKNTTIISTLSGDFIRRTVDHNTQIFSVRRGDNVDQTVINNAQIVDENDTQIFFMCNGLVFNQMPTTGSNFSRRRYPYRDSRFDRIESDIAARGNRPGTTVMMNGELFLRVKCIRNTYFFHLREYIAKMRNADLRGDRMTKISPPSPMEIFDKLAKAALDRATADGYESTRIRRSFNIRDN